MVNIDGVNTCSHLPKTWEIILSKRTWNGKFTSTGIASKVNSAKRLENRGGVLALSATVWLQNLWHPFPQPRTLETSCRGDISQLFLSKSETDSKAIYRFSDLCGLGRHNFLPKLGRPHNETLFYRHCLTSQSILHPSPTLHRNHSGMAH